MMTNYEISEEETNQYINDALVNYKSKHFETTGIDLSTFNKERMIARFKNVTVTGINVLILIYKPPVEKVTPGGLIIPETSVQDDLEYNSMVGMVLKLGPDSYTGDQFPSGVYVKVGDWVIFPRGSSLQSKYEGEPIIIVEDFKIKLLVDNPSKVSR
jgi:co-chaperonin GroES (HSP10)